MNSTTFSLQGLSLKLDSAQDINVHLSQVQDPSLINKVHFGGNTIGVEAAQAIGAFLKQTTNLKVCPTVSRDKTSAYRLEQVADFSDIFTGRLISEIPQSLEHLLSPLTGHAHLSEIDLSDNALGLRAIVHQNLDGETSFAEEDMLPFPRFVAQTPNLRVLRLSNNGLGPYASEVIADALVKVSRAGNEGGQLRAILCGRNRLEINANSKWEQALASHPHLRVVKMPQNGIRMQGVIALVRGLAHCKDLRLIDFQDNTFTLAEQSEDDEVDAETGMNGQLGVQEWCEILPGFTNLQELNLSDCFLTTEELEAEGEVSALIKTLASGSNKSLKVLRLQNNNFAVATVSALSEALDTGLANLQLLDLEANDVDEDDGTGIIANLKKILESRGGSLLMGDEEEQVVPTGIEEYLSEPITTNGDAEHSSSSEGQKTTTETLIATTPAVEAPLPVDPQSQPASATTFVPIVVPSTSSAAGLLDTSSERHIDSVNSINAPVATDTALDPSTQESATLSTPILVPLAQEAAPVEPPPAEQVETNATPALQEVDAHEAVVSGEIDPISQPAPEGAAVVAPLLDTDESKAVEEAHAKKKVSALGKLFSKMKIGKKDKESQ